jgi:hypothetical protein
MKGQYILPGGKQAMAMTYEELVKLPVTKLKEYALESKKIHGVTSMNKQALIEAICDLEGIVDESKVAAEKRRKQALKDIKKLKLEAKDLRTKRDESRGDLSRKELAERRREIKKVKRKTRRLSRV